MYCQGMTNTGSLWVLHFKPHSFQGAQLDFFHSKTTVLCGIDQIIGGRGVIGRAYLGLYLLVVEHGTTVSGYSWCKICSDPTKPYHCMSVFRFYVVF